MDRTRVPAILLLGLLLASCGGGRADEPAADPAPTEAATAATASPTPSSSEQEGSGYTREQVIEALGVTPGRDENGVPNSDLRTGCFAKKIFLTEEDNMAAYVQIGDPVATNPSGAVGVFVGNYSGVSPARCLRLFVRRLARLG